MKSQRILITGANGYLGAQFSQHLAAQGHRITALCYPSIPSDTNWCNAMESILTGSLSDEAVMGKLTAQTFDAVIHLVSLDHHQSQAVSPEEALRINVLPCWNLLRELESKGLKRFVFFSTIHVYGALKPEIILEQTPVRPGNVYALTHTLSEEICRYYNRTSSVKCMTVRLSNSYGNPVFPENNCWWLAVNDLCRTAFTDKEIRLLSDGSPQRDFIHGSDVSRALECLLTVENEALKDTIYHIAASQTLTLLELAGLVQEVYCKRYGVKIPVNLPDEKAVSDFNRYANAPRYTIDTTPLKQLGFVPACDLKTGIDKLFNYLESQCPTTAS